MNAFKTIVYMGGMHGFFTYYLPWQLALYDPWSSSLGNFRFLGYALWVAGTFVIVHCSLGLIRQGRGTPAHLDPPKSLVVTGLYRYVRNPIYGGALLVQLGTMVWHGSVVLLVYFLLFLLAFHILIVFFEEPILKQTFGRVYEEYRRVVPRWIPRLTSK